MLGTPSRPQTAPAKSARSSEKTTPLTTLEVRRLKRLKEIEHMLKRKDMLRASPSGVLNNASVATGNRSCTRRTGLRTLRV